MCVKFSCVGCAPVFLLLLCSVPFLTANYNPEEFTAGVNELINTCMDGRYHKGKPGPEDSLHSQCAPWVRRSCCTPETSINSHYQQMYKFDWSHCAHYESLSSKCQKHFQQDLCFYECSPNVGPWLVNVTQKIRNQRFVDVPLCRSDCEDWFNDCMEDYTCTDNWGLNFEWTQVGNRCPSGSICRKFKHIYNNNATYFCETVWDHSWKVVDDTEHCMRLWFDSSSGNPNDAVAKWKAEEMVKFQLLQTSAASLPSHFSTILLLMVGVIFKCCDHVLNQI